MPSIPASAIVNVIPNVVGVGGSGLDLVGLFLTDSGRVPIGAVQRFASSPAVAAFFGPTSNEATLAATYFAGYDGSTIKPAALLFVQYPTSAVAAYLRGGNLGLSLAGLQALSGVLTIKSGGATTTSATINLASATSYSNAATLIQAGFTGPPFTVAYDSVSGAFVFTNTATGVASAMDFATGPLAASLALTAATGAVVSQGAAQATPAAAMAGVVAATQNFVSFTTTFMPSAADRLAFATWNAAQGNRYLYAMGDSDPVPTQANDTASLGYQVNQGALSGTVPIWDPNSPARVAAFFMGALASINFSRTNGRVNLAFRSGSTVPAGVTNATTATNLQASGYNFYAAYATANQGFAFFYPGQIAGPFLWIDTYINEVWMNAGFQLALIQLLLATGQLPYNADGYAMVETAMLPQIAAAVSYGAIRAGVTLSATQIAQVNAAAGRDIATTLSQRGWYALALPASPAVRAARGSPPVYFWYTDGQSIQQITLNSIAVE